MPAARLVDQFEAAAGVLLPTSLSSCSIAALISSFQGGGPSRLISFRKAIKCATFSAPSEHRRSCLSGPRRVRYHFGFLNSRARRQNGEDFGVDQAGRYSAGTDR